MEQIPTQHQRHRRDKPQAQIADDWHQQRLLPACFRHGSSLLIQLLQFLPDILLQTGDLLA